MALGTVPLRQLRVPLIKVQFGFSWYSVQRISSSNRIGQILSPLVLSNLTFN